MRRGHLARHRRRLPTTPEPHCHRRQTQSRPIGDVSLARYAFSTDSLNDPTCYDVCAATWLPLLSEGKPTGGIGGNQVTYKGIPLYLYAGDKIYGDANGLGLDIFGGEWHVLTKDGRPLA